MYLYYIGGISTNEKIGAAALIFALFAVSLGLSAVSVSYFNSSYYNYTNTTGGTSNHSNLTNLAWELSGHTSDNSKVNKSGDVMTGNLTIEGNLTTYNPVLIASAGSGSRSPGFIINRTATDNQFHLQHYYPGLSYFSQNYYRLTSGIWTNDSSGSPGAGVLFDTRPLAGQTIYGYIGLYTVNASYQSQSAGVVKNFGLVLDNLGNVSIGSGKYPAAPGQTEDQDFYFASEKLDVNGSARLRRLAGSGNDSVIRVDSTGKLIRDDIQGTGTYLCIATGTNDIYRAVSC